MGKKPTHANKKGKVSSFIKSPLRCPSGKSRAVSQIIDKIYPKRITCPLLTFCCWWLNRIGTSKQRNYGLCITDAFEPLVHFWQVLLKNAPYLAEVVRQYEQMTPNMFYNLQKTFFALNDSVEIAAAFFALNRSSFSGTTLSGGMSLGHPRFTQSSIEKLKEFSAKNITVDLADFKISIARHANDFLYCDTPYLIPQKLYGKKVTNI
ncbi:MAG: adenine methyltransferase [Candidatus Liberibacter europaeus]|nr:adenine methyltransferase [Candidatus Liberibacter europaeus]